MPVPSVSTPEMAFVCLCARCVCVYLCAGVLIEFKIQLFKETHSICGQMLLEEDTSSNSLITMTSIKEAAER